MKEHFGIKHTNVTKGFLILLMIFHHVFSADMFNTCWKYRNAEWPFLVWQLAYFGRVCVGGFCFLSAYGLTMKLMNEEQDTNRDIKLILRQLIKLYFLFWPIFLIGIVGTFFCSYFGERSLTDIYISPNSKHFSLILMLVDGLGLSNIFGTPSMNDSWWYFTIALFVILAISLYNRLYMKYGISMVCGISIFVYASGNVQLIIPVIVTGIAIIFARERVFFRMSECIHNSKYHLILGILLTAGMYLNMKMMYSISNPNVWIPIGTIICILFCYLVLFEIPVLRWLLEFLGKYSANIFFIHTFIYRYWLREQVYSSGNLIIIYVLVISISLVVSMLIEGVKRVSKYNVLRDWLIKRLGLENN